MNDTEAIEQDDERAGLLPLAVASVAAGAATGTIGVLFRFSLERAEGWRTALVAWGHAGHEAAFVTVVVFVLFVLAAATVTGLAAWLVARFAPMASGSGIPHVEAVLRGKLPPAPLVLIPIKFVGGVLAIGAGLALGREGPTVQMGASIAHAIGGFFRRSAGDCRVLLAAGAGAGLATAFNAPIAGAVFVLEELMRRFDTRTAVAALGASASAIAMARLLHGDLPDFHVPAQPFPGFAMTGAHLVLGALLGLLGAAYCRAILWALDAADSFARPGSVPHATVHAGLIGAAVGLLAWFAPDLAGGGDALTERALLGTGAVAGVMAMLALRFVLGAVSYAAATPGGLFAPMLVLGAQTGLVFGRACLAWFPGMSAVAGDTSAFAVVGMAAFFVAVVRAPVTGIVLVTEMTAGFTLLLPMLTACFTAMIVPMLLRIPPIYDSLGERAARKR
ncbi:ClC family H(+)/Cl(-) exchange transporter [Caballeronia ptereochthonis]|uniref:Voltage-gated ClC-type chloride channel ClcB n=1 Tax=Caballeronia ptereochthonis TaxID=1777144 RepID=A0A158DKP3_9BURK|nr:ClC family H(+)/Cl(-) exchange transporter [Caballeronia ptereochthonis]SAK94337.1 voltage-gated ClC-type chloride channel ClcB [Caballeronia ptereochthonis]